MAQAESFVAFFYGTLMTEQVLSRVVYGTLTIPKFSNIVIHQASLNGYFRFKVKNCDYPAVVSEKKFLEFNHNNNDNISNTVSGTIVYNLSSDNIKNLDKFEGDEYVRETVLVKDLKTDENINAQIYLWKDPIEKLEIKEWDLQEFKNMKMENWISEEMNDLGTNDPRGNRWWN